MKVIGLTGSFGTGKTTVSSVFRRLGAEVFDADKIAHSVIRKGTPAYRKVIDAFGGGVLTGAGNIDRKKLGRLVFGNRRRVRCLNAIIHPAVIDRIEEGIRKSKKKLAVIDAPLLVEASLVNMVDKLIVVKASRENQIKRCMKKFGISRKDVLKRTAHQISLEDKVKLADYVIDNNGKKNETGKQVKRIWEELWR